MSREPVDFADFCSWLPCLRALLASGVAPAAAEDQLAEAFARSWVSWRRVSVHPAPRAWVLRTALNVGTSWWRQRKHEVGTAGRDHPNAADEAASGLVAVLTTKRSTVCLPSARRVGSQR